MRAAIPSSMTWSASFTTISANSNPASLFPPIKENRQDSGNKKGRTTAPLFSPYSTFLWTCPGLLDGHPILYILDTMQVGNEFCDQVLFGCIPGLAAHRDYAALR